MISRVITIALEGRVFLYPSVLTDKKAECNEVWSYSNCRWDLVCAFLSTMFASLCVIFFDNLLSLVYSASSLLKFRSCFFQEDFPPEWGILTWILIEPHEIKTWNGICAAEASTRLEMVNYQVAKAPNLPICKHLVWKQFLNISPLIWLHFYYDYILLSNIYF